MDAGGTAIVAVEGLRKVYRGRRREHVAVNGVSFQVRPGEIVGLLGPNGAGKTTTIKSLCGLVTPTAGRIDVGGVDVVAHPRRAARTIASVLEGNRNIYWRLTPVENLELFAGLQGRARAAVRSTIDDLLTRFTLTEKATTPARQLSKGMQQKLAIACAMIRGTEVLVLDEPTLGLDVEASHDLRTHIRELAASEGRTVLLSSHDMAVVRAVCDRVIILSAGRVVTDDRIENLLALFRVRAFRFELGAAPAEGLGPALTARFPGARLTSTENGATVDVELMTDEAFYDVVDVLREHGCVVVAAEHATPDLEQVFLHLVREGRA